MAPTPSLPVTDTDTGRRPDATSARIEALDLARFLALVGMMSAHLQTWGRPAWVGFLNAGFPSTLFAVLAGMSAVLSTRRYTDDGRHLAAALSLATRGLLVLGAGLALDHVPSGIMVVLPYLGTALVCAALLLRARSRWLLALAAALWLAGPHVSFLVRTPFTFRTAESLAMAPPPPGFLITMFLAGEYPVVTWLVYVLVGVVLARGLRAATDRDRLPRFALVVCGVGALAFVAATVVDAVYTRASLAPRVAEALGIPFGDAVGVGNPGSGGQPWGQGWDLVLTASPHTGTTGDVARTLGFACVVIGVLLILARHIGPRVRTVLRPVLAAGAIPLTAYTLHVLGHGIASHLLIAYVDTSRGYQDPTTLPWFSAGLGILAVHVAGLLLLGSVAYLLHRRGPLEALVSRLARAAAELGLRRRSGRLSGSGS